MAEKTWTKTDDVKRTLGVTTSIISTWVAKEGFPKNARKLIDGKMHYDVEALKRFLKKWPAPKRGRKPSWFNAVGHKLAA